MRTTEIAGVIAGLFSELVDGAPGGGGAFVLNSGDAGLLASLDKLSAAAASQSVHGGATIAAHARHVAYGLSLMNRWAREGGNPFADAKWDAAWKTTTVDAAEWDAIRRDLREQSRAWREALASPRDVAPVDLSGMIGSVAHLAYHLGAIRQIDRTIRGPREGTFQ